MATTNLLRVPQARCLKALYPNDKGVRPALSRAKLAQRAGFTPVSGTVTRALSGVREGSSSGDAHKGLLDLGYVKRLELDIDGGKETAYQITAAGIKAYERHIAATGRLPKHRDKDISTNHRYVTTE